MANYAEVLADLLSGDDVSGSVGYDEIADLVGLDEIADVVGAMPTNKKQKLAQLIAARQAGASVVRPVERDKRLLQAAPWNPVAVAAAAAQVITINPQRLIQIHSIHVPGYLSADFVVTDIRVGQQTQFVQAGQIPCTAFMETAVDQRHALKLASADLGQNVQIDFLSIAAVQRTLRGTTFCVAIF